MHSHSCLPACRGSTKVAVLDTIHGASVIARRMVELGIEAKAMEVYHHSPEVQDFDLVAAPVHLWPGNPVLAEARGAGKKIITHHRAVGELLSSKIDPDLKVFEVTGTHSKTSTALLLARTLSGKYRVLSHTTRGLELWSGGSSSLIDKGLSITPANVLLAAKEAESHNVEAMICEVSLGGTGLADFGVLTSFSGDYLIAGRTRWASRAKLQMASLAKMGSKIIANADVKISSDMSFGAGGYVQAKRDRLFFGGWEFSLEYGQDLDFQSYQTAISATAAACHAAGLGFEEIISSLSGFEGFSGRMKVSKEQGITIYDNSNSGLKLGDVNRAMDLASGSRLALVVGEESETVCEGMDIPGLLSLLKFRRDDIDFLVLVGKRLEPYAGELKAISAGDLAAGIEKAKALGLADRLLLCVKCFR